MSWVTNVLVCCPLGERLGSKSSDTLTEALGSEFAAAGGRPGSFQAINGYAGGNKAMEVQIFAAAFNQLNIEMCLHYLFALPWDYPDELQVFIQDDDEAIFTLYHKGEDTNDLVKYYQDRLSLAEKTLKEQRETIARQSQKLLASGVADKRTAHG